MPRPNMDKIEKMLAAGESFSLTNSQYKQKTGLDLPKNNSYLIHKSAVAKQAEKNGFRIVVHERKITFERLVNQDE